MLIDIKGGYKTHVYTCMYYIYVYNMSCTRTCTRTPNLSSNDYNGVLLFRNVYVDFLQHDIPTGWYVIVFGGVLGLVLEPGPPTLRHTPLSTHQTRTLRGQESTNSVERVSGQGQKK